MDEKASGTSPWSINGAQAYLCAGPLSAELELARPDAGLHAISVCGHKLTAGLHCVHRIPDSIPGQEPVPWDKFPWPLPEADAYVRGNDLVITYSTNDEWPFSPQIYREANCLACVPTVLASMSLLVSVQTHLLDTWPRIGVRSGLACGEILRVTSSDGRFRRTEPISLGRRFAESTEACCIVYRLLGAPLSYIEIMLANDYCDVKVQKLGSVGGDVKWELFSEFLEKGVIRRARLHSAFVRRENDVEVAAACCEAVQRSDLPLTT
jgi:hypothetical protein